MGRRAAQLCLGDESLGQTDARRQANLAAASAILLKIAARIDARQAAAPHDDAASNAHTPSTPDKDDDQ